MKHPISKKNPNRLISGVLRLNTRQNPTAIFGNLLLVQGQCACKNFISNFENIVVAKKYDISGYHVVEILITTI